MYTREQKKEIIAAIDDVLPAARLDGAPNPELEAALETLRGGDAAAIAAIPYLAGNYAPKSFVPSNDVARFVRQAQFVLTDTAEPHTYPDFHFNYALGTARQCQRQVAKWERWRAAGSPPLFTNFVG